MRIVKVDLKSMSPYSQSRYHNAPKLERELPDAYERRTWRERMHVNGDGHVFIPATMLKNALSEAAKYMSLSVPGRGKATYTKNIVAGVLVVKPIVLPDKKADVQPEELFLPSNGKIGGGSRVMRVFPLIPEWKGQAEFIILDDIITKDVFTAHLEAAGSFIGLGRFRPRNNGYYGRFEITKVQWPD